MGQPVETLIKTLNKNISGWNQPFNKISFLNNDTTNSVWISDVEVKAGYQMVIALNEGEYNVTDFDIDFKGSTTALLVVIMTKYIGQKVENLR